ncbi:MAG: putative HAF family extracellular repeat protein [Paracoccaceae bacterium]|jgi:probable HAF family extracellular repeat protein
MGLAKNLCPGLLAALVIFSVCGASQAAPFIIGLGDLPGGSITSHNGGIGRVLSNDGSVVVGRSNSAGGDEAFRWTPSGGMAGLGDLAGGSFFSQALSTSVDGSVVVGQGTSASVREAFRWTEAGGMAGLGDLAGGRDYSSARGISADGSAIVGYGNSDNGWEAFRWTESGGMVGLGDLAGGSFRSLARNTSSDGSVVVGQGNSADGSEAFRWTESGGMVGLGELAGGSFYSEALSVSGDGSVTVGTSISANGLDDNGDAFIWDADNGMRALSDVLVSDYGLDLTGWSLQQARGISDDGQFIAGYAKHNGNFEAFLVNLRQDVVVAIPEPGGLGLALFGLGAVGLGYARRRRAA